MRALWHLPDAVGLIWLPLLLLARSAAARKHHLFVGNADMPAAIHSIVFDDETLQLNRSRTFIADAPHSWITFNHDMTHVYGASLAVPRIATYDVINNTFIRLTAAINARQKCANRTQSYIVATKRFPHFVFSASSPGPNACGMTTFPSPTGELADMASSWTYGNRSGIEGLALGWGPLQLLYSADTEADALWTHGYGWYGETYFAQKYQLPANSSPRKITTHPYGKYLYAVMETSSQLVSFILDPYSGNVKSNDTMYSLLPPGYNASNYEGADLTLSRNSKYLWATTRAKADTPYYGYVSGFLLDNDGFIAKKMFTVPTTTTGGTSNAVSAAPWADEWMALADYPTGYVQMWRMRGPKDSENGVEYNNAEPVAKLNMTDGGCCANAIWYN